eukprot:CAMPEP_0177599448 /NCGR_PEP_ID=MMETSP0419_2-20121207/12998_1 /TAXON_ID=582737 /ORGANISM="Tetraselmis sp., Strain GSL018" /LENGTH=195 /DNA_ID=CAMNT_0019092181 /DNA_START=1366 /DNA_END=1953 /DNA_ORIENTATION=-
MNLPRDIVVRSIAFAPRGFDAMRSALGKRYHYRIFCGDAPDPLRRHEQWWVSRRWCAAKRRLPAYGESYALDVRAMREAAALVEGTHDFSAFRDTNSSAKRDGGAVRRVTSLLVQEEGGPENLLIAIEGEAFLFRMVRIIAATLVEIGAGRAKAQLVADALRTKDRRLLPKAAPPEGLTLHQVFYASDFMDSESN